MFTIRSGQWDEKQARTGEGSEQGGKEGTRRRAKNYAVVCDWGTAGN